MARQSKNEKELLATWEEIYKRGLLTFWILLLLANRSAYVYEMSAALHTLSNETISATENSIYRALARFESLGLVVGTAQASPAGPARKYYQLTDAGTQLLASFIQRNLFVFQQPSLIEHMQAVVHAAQQEKTS